MLIALKDCTIETCDYGCITRWSDGAESSNWPLTDLSYHRVVQACGHTDPKRYCFEHDFCHLFLSERLFGVPSYTVWNSAHGTPIDTSANMWEERTVFYFQQALRNLCPLEATDPLWSPLVAEARKLLEIDHEYS